MLNNFRTYSFVGESECPRLFHYASSLHPIGLLRRIHNLLTLKVIQSELIHLRLLFLLLCNNPYFIGTLSPAILIVVREVRPIALVLGFQFLCVDHVLNVEVNGDCFTDPHYFLLLDALLHPHLFFFPFLSFLSGIIAIHCALAESFKVQCIAVLA